MSDPSHFEDHGYSLTDNGEYTHADWDGKRKFLRFLLLSASIPWFHLIGKPEARRGPGIYSERGSWDTVDESHWVGGSHSTSSCNA